MPMPRYNPKRDANEPEIAAALRAVGAAVKELSIENCPDLLVGFRGRNYLIEVKAKGGKLTEGQKTWHEEWSGQRALAWTVDEALRAIGAID